MNPATLSLMIPILALCIPIAAIITAGKNKRAQSATQNSGGADVERLEARVAELEQEIAAINSNVLQIEEKQDFLNLLLEDKSD